ncbi:MAG: hypothetical protein ACSLFR_09430 [Solirubrobacteraceae bacterium]
MSAVTSPVKASRAQDTEHPEPGVRWGIELAWLAVTSLLSLVMFCVMADVWKMSLHVPIVLGGDATYGLVLVKTLVANPWIEVNRDIGAPYGSVLYDHTSIFGDFTQLLLIKAMSLGMTSPSALLNVFFFLTFPIVTACTYIALRVLGFDRSIAATCALVYTFLPLHFVRGLGHVMLSAYYAVPIAGVVILGLLGRVELFRRRSGDGPRIFAWASGRTLLTLGACLFIGASEAYYALFTVAIAAPVGLLAALAGGSARRLAATAAVCVTVLSGMVAVQAPTLIYRMQNGANENVAVRSGWESELYGLRITSLVLPLPNHRIQSFSETSRKYYDGTQLNGEGANAALGLLMTFGLLLGITLAATNALGRSVRTERWKLARDAGVAGLFAVLLGTVSGGSALLAYLVSSQIRGWNRISVFVAFFALIGLAAALSALRARWLARGWPAWIGALALFGVAVFALYEQSPNGTPLYEANRAAWQNDARFGAAVEAALPQGTMVLQLPYVPFPENPAVNKMEDYSHLMPYVHTDGLKWSYGATKGRYPDDWGAFAKGVPRAQFLPAAVAAGFGAVYVDRFGYKDNGKAVERDIRRLTGGGPTVTSADGRYVLYDLAPVRAEEARDATPQTREAAKNAVLRPVALTWSTGFYGKESDTRRTWYWGAKDGAIAVENRSDAPRVVDMSFKVLTPGPESSRLVMTLPDGTRRVFRTHGNDEPPTRIRTQVPIPPGTSTLTLSTNAPDEVSDARDIRMQIIDPVLREAAYSEIAASVDGRPG